VGGLVERIERHPLAAVADRLVEVTGRFGPVRKRLQRPATTFAVHVAGRQHPVFAKAGEHIAGAQPERLLVLSGGDQRVEGARVDPRLRLSGQTYRLAARDQYAVRGRAERAPNARQRVAQTCPRARLKHIRPQATGDLRARMNPRVQRQPAEQRLRGPAGRRRRRRAVHLERERPEHTDPDHGSGSVAARSQCGRALTKRLRADCAALTDAVEALASNQREEQR